MDKNINNHQDRELLDQVLARLIELDEQSSAELERSIAKILGLDQPLTTQ